MHRGDLRPFPPLTPAAKRTDDKDEYDGDDILQEDSRMPAAPQGHTRAICGRLHQSCTTHAPWTSHVLHENSYSDNLQVPRVQVSMGNIRRG
jgi:hypothetical protein